MKPIYFFIAILLFFFMCIGIATINVRHRKHVVTSSSQIIIHDTPVFKTGYAVWRTQHRPNEYRTEIPATDTIYSGGCLFLFDTINFIYRKVGTVSINKQK